MNITIIKNPGLGFSVAGGVGLQGNPYKPHDEVRPDQRNSLSLTYLPTCTYFSSLFFTGPHMKRNNLIE